MTRVRVTGFPYIFGQPLDEISGAADYLRQHGLIKRMNRFCDVVDYGNLTFDLTKDRKLTHKILDMESNSKANELISNYISSADSEDFFLNIGGDHGMGLGTIHGLLNLHQESVVVWADAHGDINTPDSSPSGHFHGMPLAFLLKISENEQFSWIKNRLMGHKLILIGQRDLDQGEKEIIETLGIQCYSSDDLNRMGAKEILEIALHKADPLGIYPIHLSFDVDLFDGHDIPSTGTRVYQGPRLEEVFLLGGLLGETGRLKSMDIVEFNPTLGTQAEIQSSTELILDFVELTLTQVIDRTKKQMIFLTPQFLSEMFSSEILR